MKVFEEEDERFVSYLDPETEPDPEFAGMPIPAIWDELDRIEEAAWHEQLYLMEYQHMMENYPEGY